MTVELKKQPSFDVEGVEIKTLHFLQSDDVKNLTNEIYSKFKPARNATNQICRSIRWGGFANNELHWNRNNSYRLSSVLNPDEKGNTRYMDLIPDEFLEHPAIQQLINVAYGVYHPGMCTEMDSYIVQLSALRYEPSVTQTCYPSPDRPHQDGFNNGIAVLNRTDNLIGGHTRIFDLDDQLIYETNLDSGQAVFVKDDAWKHQVLPMMVNTEIAGPDAPCHRDILIVRIDKAKR